MSSQPTLAPAYEEYREQPRGFYTTGFAPKARGATLEATMKARRSLRSEPALAGDSGEDSRDGFVRDYVSREWVRATPEEVEAVQVLARRLVEDYGYSEDQIQTHP